MRSMTLVLATTCIFVIAASTSANVILNSHWDGDTPRSGFNPDFPTEVDGGARSGGASGAIAVDPTGGQSGFGGALSPAGGNFFYFSGDCCANPQQGTLELYLQFDGQGMDAGTNQMIAMFDPELSKGTIWQQDLFGLFVATRPIAGLPSSASLALGWDNAEPVLHTDITGWTASEWHHAAFTWDQASDEYSLFVDGALIGTKSITGAGEQYGPARMPPANMGEGIRIGGGTNGGEGFHGLLDELVIFDRVEYTGNFTPRTVPYGTVIPEPAMGVTVLGLAAVALARRRRTC